MRILLAIYAAVHKIGDARNASAAGSREESRIER